MPEKRQNTHELISPVDPTLKLGEIAVRDIQAEVLAIFELPETDFGSAVSAFVATRMEELKTNNLGAIDLDTTRVDDFITPEVEMIPSRYSRPYHMDDPRAYEVSFKRVKQQFEAIAKGNPDFEVDRIFLNAAIRGTQIGQVDYFGSYVGHMRNRLGLVADVMDVDLPERESIAIFGPNAVCQERAAVVHNTLKIMGIDSRFIVGDLGTAQSDNQTGKSESHAWIVIKSRSGKFSQFDPTNPIIYKNSDGNPIWCDPNIKVLSGGEESDVGVVLKEMSINEDGSRTSSDKCRLHYTYPTNPF